ncbi:hypothetical protein [uncultured Pedobacter sp.]|uniref:hypothetical protein n=1 Tax=uncultured Pedobacter sp. TaxID=246139 RepID=UPI0025D086C8|nr:hypothetical protein [uncultured Pedobacter sp.]
MGELRKGYVTKIDLEYGQGIITDENDQDIHFQLDHVSDQITLNSKIVFEIELQACGLVAVNVKLALGGMRVNTFS